MNTWKSRVLLAAAQAVQHSGDSVPKHRGDDVASLRFQLEFHSVPQMPLVLM